MPAEETRLAEMLSQHYRLVWRTLRRLGVHDAGVDDAAQQVFIVASEKMADIIVGKERAFLLATAAGIAANARRSQRRKREDELEETHEPADPAPGPEEAAALSQARALLDEALDAMSDELRLVFVLYELEELSTPEIAGLLEVPVGTAASRLRRARARFAAEVDRIRARLDGQEGRNG